MKLEIHLAELRLAGRFLCGFIRPVRLHAAPSGSVSAARLVDAEHLEPVRIRADRDAPYARAEHRDLIGPLEELRREIGLNQEAAFGADLLIHPGPAALLPAALKLSDVQEPAVDLVARQRRSSDALELLAEAAEELLIGARAALISAVDRIDAALLDFLAVGPEAVELVRALEILVDLIDLSAILIERLALLVGKRALLFSASWLSPSAFARSSLRFSCNFLTDKAMLFLRFGTTEESR